MSKEIEVLILDDEPVVLERLGDYLQKRGLSVETFGTSLDALERLKEKTFHVVVTDIKMAAPDGIEVMVSVKKASPETEVIMITGFGSSETMRAAEAVGAFDYVQKPFNMEEVHKKIMKAAARADKRMR